MREEEDRPVRRRVRPAPGGGSVAIVLGVASLVMGLASLALCWVPLLRWGALAAAGVGLTVGIVGTVIGLAQKGASPVLPLLGGLSSLLALLVTAVLLVVSAFPVPGPGPGHLPPAAPAAAAALPGWGDVFDPDGDCTVERQGQALSVNVPATPHDLSAELGQVNSPRVLQAVEGDFSAQVKVCGALRPTTPPSVLGRVPFQSAGLLLWSDGGNYVRLERAGLNRNGAINSYVGFELRADSQMAGAQSSPLPEQDAWLRVERRGNQVFGSVSSDGRRWTALQPINVTFPAKVQVGVAVVNAAQQPLSVRFEEFQLGR
jgi:regulation of enolase protein 1 (concanavalin A-like superfamily)